MGGSKFSSRDLPSAEIKRLYLAEKWSTYRIARKYGCSQNTIYSRLQALGVVIRSLRQAKSLATPRYFRKNFCGDPTLKAYLVGFRMGDLNVSQTSAHSPTIRVGTNSTKTEQLQLFKQLFSPFGHIWIGRPDSRGAQYMRCYVNNSFAFLLPKDLEVPSWIKQEKVLLAHFCAGYFDAEGTICLVRGNAVVSIKSQDEKIIKTFYGCIKSLGVVCGPVAKTRLAGHVSRTGVRTNKNVWQLTIYRKDGIILFAETIGKMLKHPKRRQDMKIALSNIEQRNARYGRPQSLDSD